MICLKNPTKAYLVGYEDRKESLKSFLQYKNLSIYYQYKRLIDTKYWYIKKYGDEAYERSLENLKNKIYNCLLFEDRDGLWTYSGLAQKIADKYEDRIEVDFEYPEYDIVPWYRTNRKTPREYQQEAHDLLLNNRHGAVEIFTGGGKTLLAVMLGKTVGLQTVISCPSVSIAEQMYNEFTFNFGKKYVGMYGDGKKEIDKLFTISIAQSLIKIQEGTKEWEFFSKTKQLIFDEAHTCAAETLSELCLGLFQDTPFRFFVSGTQLRTDGLDLLLEGITGPVLIRKDVREGVDNGFLSKPIFTVLNVKTDSTVTLSKDTNKLTRKYLYYDKKINKIAAEWANKFVDMGKSVLILIEEIEQFSYLIPYLKHKYNYAHGGLNKNNASSVPKEFSKSDPNKLVKELNEGRLPILIGTSCVAVGTDFTSLGAIIYLRGGKSPIEIKQSVGRGTRLYPGKTEFFFLDFNVQNVAPLHNHAEKRSEIYNEIYGPVNFIDVGD